MKTDKEDEEKKQSKSKTQDFFTFIYLIVLLNSKKIGGLTSFCFLIFFL